MNLHGKDIKIFAGNACPKEAAAIAKNIGIPLGQCTVKHFADGEISVSLEESVRGSDVFVVQSSCNPVNDNLMELLIMIDALRRASAGRINAVIPYFGYARQDRKARPREPISAKLVANMITAAGADRVLTMDLHAAQIQGFFDIPVDHLLGVPILSPYFQPLVHGHEDEYVAVSPDFGSVTRARKFVEKLDIPIAIIDKRRPKANDSEVMNIIGDVRGKKCIIVDDMVDTAGTLCHAADALIQIGGAVKIVACATHAVLSDPAIERLQNSCIDELVFLDTIPLPPEKRIDKITVLPVAPIFAEAIERIYGERPISPLFERQQ
ncbi:MAG TPA: ribose-phosphate diphosphokinase [Oscillospiraceae bacterium]|nr:ribose-phosphate diphosphokinase [Oscillospiraceae bacterium]HNW05054.1 ribose-phosphate diphosphokinase [Oscillospiraceae bacterium]